MRTYPFEATILNFSSASLEPAISPETTKAHYTNHYMSYIDDLNEILAKYPTYQNWSLAKLAAFPQALPSNIRTITGNAARGVFNHELYWHTLKSYTCEDNLPCGNLATAICQSFGDYENFQKSFSSVALRVAGSSWVWLVTENKSGKLFIQQSSNYDTPLNGRFSPILALDLWEHAYYAQYQNNRQSYITNWWQIIDWQAADTLYKNATSPTNEPSSFSLAQLSSKSSANTPGGCKSTIEATPAGESYYTHKHLNTFTNPCGSKSHASNSYYSTKMRRNRKNH